MARYENLNVTKMNGGGSLFYLKGENKNISANATVDAQTMESLTIPAGVRVLQVYTQILTAANATCTATVGDGTAAAGWDAEVNMTAAAGTRTAAVIGTDAYAVGKLYSSKDTIDHTITFSTSTTTGIYRCDALCSMDF